MPDPTFIPGYLGTITLNTDPIITASAFNLNEQKNIMSKPVIGVSHAYTLAGQTSATFDISGHISVEQYPELRATFASQVPVAFSVQIGDGAGATDAGLLTGLVAIGNLTTSTTADGEWDFTCSGQTSGVITYTPATP